MTIIDVFCQAENKIFLLRPFLLLISKKNNRRHQEQRKPRVDTIDREGKRAFAMRFDLTQGSHHATKK